jgi:hypothetical protein
MRCAIDSCAPGNERKATVMGNRAMGGVLLADESNDPFAETSKLAKDLGLTECAS